MLHSARGELGLLDTSTVIIEIPGDPTTLNNLNSRFVKHFRSHNLLMTGHRSETPKINLGKVKKWVGIVHWLEAVMWYLRDTNCWFKVKLLRLKQNRFFIDVQSNSRGPSSLKVSFLFFWKQPNHKFLF